LPAGRRGGIISFVLPRHVPYARWIEREKNREDSRIVLPSHVPYARWIEREKSREESRLSLRIKRTKPMLDQNRMAKVFYADVDSLARLVGLQL
jgi:superfamily II DNA/RNA helicase